MVEYEIKKVLNELNDFDQKMQFLQQIGEFINRQSQLIASRHGAWVDVIPEDYENEETLTGEESDGPVCS